VADVTRNVGLSLGADICWPMAYEAILKRLDLAIPVGDDTVRIDVERVSIEPFRLQQTGRYDVIIDRLTHWYATSREWIKKSVLLDDAYVFNNPWTLQSMEKHTSYCGMMRLGMPVPDTWLIPPKAYEPSADLQPTLERYARYFDLEDIGNGLGYPVFMKPYAGGGWVGVTKADDADALKRAYEESGKLLMHVQKGVVPYDLFVRCVGLGPQTRTVQYDPGAPLHDRYGMARDFASADDARQIRDITLTINAFFGWDFNSCEVLVADGTCHPIDFANACPDSQVTSLHYHFPWLIKANIRWSVFNAVLRRRMRMNPDWRPFLDAAETDGSFDDKLPRYAAIANERFDTDRFEAFCAEHLGHLDEVAWEWFGSDEARDAVRQKVAALYPAHEIDEFSEMFFGRIQRWRDDTGARPDPVLAS